MNKEFAPDQAIVAERADRLELLVRGDPGQMLVDVVDKTAVVVERQPVQFHVRQFVILLRGDVRLHLFDAEFLDGFGDLSLHQPRDGMDYLQAHLRDANIESFARHLHYSPSYASRFFKRCTGQTFSDALRALRLKRAAQLLNEGELSVDEIMELVGYSGRTNFYASFHRCYGSTPSTFRREHAQKI